MTYKAKVCRVHTKPHPNADRIQLGNAGGYQVVVSLETSDGDLGVYFHSDGQLSEEFVKANGLSVEDGGYIGEKRRIRAQNFRGERSEGLWLPMSCLDYLYEPLSDTRGYPREGEELNEIFGHHICNKYYTPKTQRAKARAGGQARKENEFFRKHPDTKKFLDEFKVIPRGSLLTISEKLHGTSQRMGKVLEDKTKGLPWYRLLWRRLKGRPDKEYVSLLGTRNVVLSEKTAGSYYGSEAFRYHIFNKVKDRLYNGEVLYGEIVGYTDSCKPIMAPQKFKKKELESTYSSPMTYDYGLPEGSCEFYLYNIKKVASDGTEVILSDMQMRARAEQLGLKAVPKLKDMLLPVAPFEKIVESFVEGPSTLDSTHIREGVAVRVDTPDGQTYFLKAKSHTFGILEGYLKDDEDYVDLEEIS